MQRLIVRGLAPILVVYVALVPLDPLIRIYSGQRFVSSTALMVLMIIATALLLRRVTWSLQYLPLCMLLLWSGFSVLWAGDITGSSLRFVLFGYAIVGTIVAGSLVAMSSLRMKVLANWYIASCILLAVGALFWYFQYGSLFAGDRVSIDELNPSWLSAFLALAAILQIDQLASHRRQFLGYLILALLIALLILTQGRNAIIALVLAVVVTGLLLGAPRTIRFLRTLVLGRSSGSWLLLLLPVVLLVVLLLHLLGFGLYDFSRLWELFSGDPAVATANRTTIWGNYLTLDTNPIVGEGLGSASSLYERAIGEKLMPHNAYLLIYIEMGMVGVFFYLMFMFSLVIVPWAVGHHEVRLLTMVAAFIVFLGAGNDVIQYRYYWIAVMFYFFVFFQREPRKLTIAPSLARRHVLSQRSGADV